ncbi:MAG: hypothetical protein AAF219_06850 [Myxococcota bacterium]
MIRVGLAALLAAVLSTGCASLRQKPLTGIMAEIPGGRGRKAQCVMKESLGLGQVPRTRAGTTYVELGLVKQRHCTYRECSKGYHYENGRCFTKAETDARKAWRLKNAVGITAHYEKIDPQSPEALVKTSYALRQRRYNLPLDTKLAHHYARLACLSGLGDGCLQLSRFHAEIGRRPHLRINRDALPADYVLAAKLQQKGCLLGSEHACIAWSKSLSSENAHLMGPERSTAVRGVIEATKPVCDTSSQAGCSVLAELYLQGDLPSRRPTVAAVAMLERVCRDSERSWLAGRSCARAASLHYNGADDLPRDRGAAKALLAIPHPFLSPATDCMRKDEEFCGMTEQEAQPEIEKTAAVSFRKGSARAHYNEASRIRGRKKQISRSTANKWREDAHLRRACELNSGNACTDYAQHLWIADNRYAALRLSAAELSRKQAQGLVSYEKACDLGVLRACSLGASLALFKQPMSYIRDTSVKPDGFIPPIADNADVAMAVRLLKRACDLGASPSCREVGLIHQVDYDPRYASSATALTYFKKACAMTEKFLQVEPCVLAAQILYNGDDEVARDKEAARRLVMTARDHARQTGYGDTFTEQGIFWYGKVGMCILSGAEVCE